MMKRKFLAVVLPIIGCATVVGSGFGAWHFGQVTGVKGTDGFQLGINVSEEVDSAIGNLTISKSNSESDLTNKTVMLDQGGQNNTNVNSGISIVDDTVGATNFNIADHVNEIDDVYYQFTVTYNGTITSLSQIYDAGMKINVSVTIDFIGGSLINYIRLQEGLVLDVTASNPNGTAERKTFTDAESVSVGAANSFVASIDITDPKGADTGNCEWTFKLDMSTTLTEGNYKNKFLKYQTSSVDDEGNPVGKPDATTEPLSMYNKLSGENAGINISTLVTLA